MTCVFFLILKTVVSPSLQCPRTPSPTLASLGSSPTISNSPIKNNNNSQCSELLLLYISKKCPKVIFTEGKEASKTEQTQTTKTQTSTSNTSKYIYKKTKTKSILKVSSDTTADSKSIVSTNNKSKSRRVSFSNELESTLIIDNWYWKTLSSAYLKTGERTGHTIKGTDFKVDLDDPNDFGPDLDSRWTFNDSDIIDINFHRCHSVLSIQHQNKKQCHYCVIL